LDVADLYKTEVAIPVAFEVAAHSPEDVGSRTRRAIRDRVNDIGLLKRSVNDVKQLLLPNAQGAPADQDVDHVALQSDHGMNIESGRNYAQDFDW
jgi:CRISPR-associated protein Cas1